MVAYHVLSFHMKVDQQDESARMGPRPISLSCAFFAREG